MLGELGGNLHRSTINVGCRHLQVFGIIWTSRLREHWEKSVYTQPKLNNNVIYIYKSNTSCTISLFQLTAPKLLIFKVLPNPSHSMIPKPAQLPEDLCEVLRSLQHFTCTPGLTGTGYIIFGAKQTGWVYTGVGCWCPTMEGLGWAWGRGEVGVVEGFGYKQRWQTRVSLSILQEKGWLIKIYSKPLINSIKSLTWAKDRGLNSLALGLSVDFLTCLNTKNKKLSWALFFYGSICN